MSQGISVKLPMRFHPGDGYTLNKTYYDSVKQNFKMLLLTAPGERMMDPLFGVGLRNYLFEQNHPITKGNIESRIQSQVKKYMPFVTVMNVEFGELDENEAIKSNSITISITYRIDPLSSVDKISVELNGEDNNL